MCKPVELLGGETVEQAVTAGGDQVLLGATAGRVGRIPRTSERHIGLRILGAGHWRKSRAINVSEHGDTRATAGPVSTGAVHVSRKGMTVLVRTGQDVVHKGCVTGDFNGLILLIKCCLFSDLVVVAVKVGDAGGDYHALGVFPGSIADAVTRVNRVRAATHSCLNRPATSYYPRAYRLRQRLTMRISTGQSTKVTPLAWTGACHKEGHVSLLRLGSRAQAQKHYDRGHTNRKAHSFFHLVSLPEDRGDVEQVSRIVHSMTTSDSTFYSINTTKFVRFGSKADILGGLRDVRFTPEMQTSADVMGVRRQDARA